MSVLFIDSSQASRTVPGTFQVVSKYLVNDYYYGAYLNVLVVKRISWTTLETLPPPSVTCSIRENPQYPEADVQVEMFNTATWQSVGS